MGVVGQAAGRVAYHVGDTAGQQLAQAMQPAMQQFAIGASPVAEHAASQRAEMWSTWAAPVGVAVGFVGGLLYFAGRKKTSAHPVG